MKKKILSILLFTTMLTTGCSSNNSSANSNQQIIIAQSTDVTSFDPHIQNNSISANATSHMYNTLVKFNENHELVGDLAESWEYLDYISIQFTLKQDVTFHNGEALTSEDVKFSLERQVEASQVNNESSSINNIDNLDNLDIINSIDIIDDYNFIINLNTPSHIVTSSLANSNACILDKTTVEALESNGQTLNDNPIGTGPYIFESYTPNSELVLKRNDDYFDNAPLNDGITFKIIPNDEDKITSLQNGDIDLIINLDNKDAQKIRDTENIQVTEYDSTTIEYLAINTTKEPFNNQLVRKAINHAINKDAIINTSLNGEGTLTNAYVAIGSPTYTENITKYDYNLEKATALLEEAGYTDGFDCTLYVDSDYRVEIAELIKEDLLAIGINLNIQQLDNTSLLNAINNGEHDLVISGLIGNSEADNNFRPLVHSSNIGEKGNYASYSNNLVDIFLDEAIITEDIDTRAGLYEVVNQMLSEEAPWTPLYTENGLVAHNSKLEGLILFPTSNHIYTNLNYPED